MSASNRELIVRAWAAYDAGDEEGFAACLTSDWHEASFDGVKATLDDERETMRLYKEAFPDKHTEFHHIVADGESVACHCTTRATHTGRYLDLEPTGAPVVMHVMMFNRVREGRLAQTWAMVDGPGFYEQLTGRTSPQGVDATDSDTVSP